MPLSSVAHESTTVILSGEPIKTVTLAFFTGYMFATDVTHAEILPFSGGVGFSSVSVGFTFIAAAGADSVEDMPPYFSSISFLYFSINDLSIEYHPDDILCGG